MMMNGGNRKQLTKQFPIDPCPKRAYCCCTHNNTTFLELNQHLGKTREDNGKVLIDEQQVIGSSRWNPTPEQIVVLEEMYRHGIRSPTADQIQQIAAQLRRFGKIEGKNVFYWFQNHKARERQKRRRELETDCEVLQEHEMESFDKKESGYWRTIFEHEQTKSLLTPPSNTRNHLEGLVSMKYRAAATSIAESRANIITTTSLKPPKRESDKKIIEVKTLELFPLCSSEDFNGVNCTKKDATEVPFKAINANFSPDQFYEFLPLKN